MWPVQREPISNVSDEDPEVKKEVKTCISSIGKPSSLFSDYVLKCSFWLRLKKVVAWLLRYRDDLLKASKSDKSKREVPKFLTPEEMERAEREILKHVQMQAFPEEFNYPKKQVKRSSRLFKLDPCIINGVLCVGGRLRNASISLETKYPIILPKEPDVTKLIIDHYHEICGHSGREYVLALIRQKYWITKGSSAVKCVLARCVSCRRRQAPLCYQKMANLPESRFYPTSHWSRQSV